MPEQLIATAGMWFLIACATEFAAVFIEQAGAARSPEEDGERSPARVLLSIASLLTPGLLLLHAFFITTDVETPVRVWLMAAPVAAMLGGALLGAVLSSLAPGIAPAMRRIAPVFGVLALAAALYAASPSLAALTDGLRDGTIELRAPSL